MVINTVAVQYHRSIVRPTELVGRSSPAGFRRLRLRVAALASALRAQPDFHAVYAARNGDFAGLTARPTAAPPGCEPTMADSLARSRPTDGGPATFAHPVDPNRIFVVGFDPIAASTVDRAGPWPATASTSITTRSSSSGASPVQRQRRGCLPIEQRRHRMVEFRSSDHAGHRPRSTPATQTRSISARDNGTIRTPSGDQRWVEIFGGASAQSTDHLNRVWAEYQYGALNQCQRRRFVSTPPADLATRNWNNAVRIDPTDAERCTASASTAAPTAPHGARSVRPTHGANGGQQGQAAR